MKTNLAIASRISRAAITLHCATAGNGASTEKANQMKLTLTPSEIYRRKNRLWKAYCDTAETVRKAFFPDTGGVGLYLHNWYICNEKSNPQGAKLAEWVETSLWARYRKLEARLDRHSVEREHKFGNHSKRGFNPLWCPICNPKHASGYGLEFRNGHWQKITA